MWWRHPSGSPWPKSLEKSSTTTRATPTYSRPFLRKPPARAPLCTLTRTSSDPWESTPTRTHLSRPTPPTFGALSGLVSCGPTTSRATAWRLRPEADRQGHGQNRLPLPPGWPLGGEADSAEGLRAGVDARAAGDGLQSRRLRLPLVDEEGGWLPGFLRLRLWRAIHLRNPGTQPGGRDSLRGARGRRDRPSLTRRALRL